MDKLKYLALVALNSINISDTLNCTDVCKSIV